MRRLINDYENDTLMEMSMQVAYNNDNIEKIAEKMGVNEILNEDDKEISIYMSNQYLFEKDKGENSKLQDMRDYFNDNISNISEMYFNRSLPAINFGKGREQTEEIIKSENRYIHLKNESGEQISELNTFLNDRCYDYSEIDPRESYCDYLEDTHDVQYAIEKKQKAMIRIPEEEVHGICMDILDAYERGMIHDISECINWYEPNTP